MSDTDSTGWKATDMIGDLDWTLSYMSYDEVAGKNVLTTELFTFLCGRGIYDKNSDEDLGIITGFSLHEDDARFTCNVSLPNPVRICFLDEMGKTWDVRYP